MSSCQCVLSKEEEVRKKRIDDFRRITKALFLGEVIKLRCYAGVTGHGDLAFKIKRLPIIIEVLRELADELEKEL